jgi:sugar diacid utilization regulator
VSLIDGRPTLQAVLERLSTGTVSVLAAPRGLDLEVGSAVICSPDDLGGVLPNDIVLAVGSQVREVPELLERATAREASAVIIAVSENDDLGLAVGAATACGMTLLLAPTDVSWGRLYALLCSAGPSAAVGVGVPAGDLFRLADAIADMVGGPVTIEDPQSVVLAYSHGSQDVDEPRRQAILGRRVIEKYVREYREAGLFRRLASSDDVLRLPGTEELRPRMAVGVHAGGEMLGSIWVAELDAPLGEEAETALRSAGGLAALHLLRHRDSDDQERRRRAETVRAVLDGRLPPEGAALALGLAVDEALSVVVFELQGLEGPDAVVLVERLADAVAMHAQGPAPGACCAAIGRRVYALLPEAGSDPQAARARVRALVPQVLERARLSLRLVVLAGIGGRAGGLAAVPRSRWEADQVLRVLSVGTSDRAWASIEEERARVILLRVVDLAADDPRLLEGPLRLLAEHDATKNTDYLLTVRTYLDCFGDVAAASRRLVVHPNTFRYRLRRLEALSGLDLRDADERLALELQMRLLDRQR